MEEKTFTLMHKNIKLASLALGGSSRVTNVWDFKKSVFFPIYENMGVSIDDFVSWFSSRSEPVSRMNNEAQRNIAVFNSMGLSLTDCYWFRPEGSCLTWEEVNFYTNGFSEEVGKSFFTNQKTDSSSSSPDYSLNGDLQKRWKYTGSRPLLLKRGKNPYQKEPFCEKIASELARRMGIPHVKYETAEDEHGYYSICEAFTDEKNELVNAKNFIRTEKSLDDKTDFQRFIEKCKYCGISDIVSKTDNMIVFDYLMLNVDRHWGNFGVVRDPDSGLIKDLAPVFDTGMSLSREYGMIFDKITDSGYQNIMLGVDMNRSLMHVHDLKNVNVESLGGFSSYIIDVFLENKHMPEHDVKDIAAQFEERLENVIKMQA